MINEVRVFNADGTLKKIIGNKEMQKRFDENNSIIATSLEKDFNLSSKRIAEKVDKKCLGCGTLFMGNRRTKHCGIVCRTKHKNKLAEKNVKARARSIHFAGEANGRLIRVCDKREPKTNWEKSRTRINAGEVDCKKCLKSKVVQASLHKISLDGIEKGLN